jgi:hypothetical protein
VFNFLPAHVTRRASIVSGADLSSATVPARTLNRETPDCRAASFWLRSVVVIVLIGFADDAHLCLERRRINDTFFA